MFARIVLAIGVLATSADVCRAQESAEGRSMSFELIVSNRTVQIVTIADIHAISSQSSGKRDHEPIRVRQQVPAYGTAMKATASGVIRAAKGGSEVAMEELFFVYQKITWTVAGAAHECNAKFPATYRASDKKIVVQMADLGALMTGEGRPIPAKCQA